MSQSPLYSYEKKKKPNKAMKLAVGLVVIFSGLTLSAPWVLSTKQGKNYLCRAYQRKTGGTLQIESLSLSFFSGQQIEGLCASDASGSYFISCQSIKSNASLYKLLFKRKFEDTVITSPHLKLKKEFTAFSHFSIHPMNQSSMLYIPVFNPDTRGFLFPFSGRVLIHDGTIDILVSQIDPVSIQEIESALFFSQDKTHQTILIKAISSQNEQTGSIFLKTSLKDINSLRSQIAIDSRISNFPVKALDQLASSIDPSLKGIFLEALGPSFSLNVQGGLQIDQASLQIQTSSNLLQASINTVSDGKTVRLSAPGTFTLSASQKLLQMLSPWVHASIPGPLNIQGLISSLELPITETGVEFYNMSIQTSYTAQPVTLTAAQTTYDIGPLSAKIDSNSLGKGIQFSLDCPIKNANQTSSISLVGFTTLPAYSLLKSSVKGEIDSLPTEILLGVYHSPSLSSVLGSQLSGSFQYTYTPDQQTLNGSIQTPTLSVGNFHLQGKESLSLGTPCQVTWQPEASVINAWIPSSQIQFASDLQPITATVRSLTLPSIHAWWDTSCQLDVETSNLSLAKLGPLSSYELENIKLSIEADTRSDIAVRLSSNLVSLQTSFAYHPDDGTLETTKSLIGSVIVTDTHLQELLSLKGPLHLDAPTALEICFEPVRFSLSDTLSKMHLKAVCKAKDILLQNKAEKKYHHFFDSLLSVDFYAVPSRFGMQFTSSLSQEDGTQSQIGITASASHFLKNAQFDVSKIKCTGDITLSGIPTSLIASLNKEASFLPALLGNQLKLYSHIDWNKERCDIELAASSPYLNITAAMQTNGSALFVKDTPLKMSLILTPESYSAAYRLLGPSAPPYTLLRNCTLQAQVSDLSLPYSFSSCSSNLWNQCLPSAIHAARIAAKFSLDSLQFSETAKQENLSISSFELMFNKKEGLNPVTLTFNSEVVANPSSLKEEKGTLRGSLEVSEIFDENHSFSFARTSSSIDLSAKRLPCAFLDFFAHTTGNTTAPFSALFGRNMNASGSLQLQKGSGLIGLDMDSPTTKASFSGRIAQGMFTLSSPLQAQIQMTPALSRFLLDKVNPLSISEIRSDAPISLEVASKGFSLPLFPLDWKGVNISSAAIDLGKISCKNEGNLNIALNLLKSVQLSQNETLNLWFTPMDLNVKSGVVRIERTDILVADIFDIAIWGEINPIKNNVNMVLGLTADCLSKAFAIKNLPNDYVLQVPMTGSLNNVKINTGKATAKVAALLALQQADLAGGLAGGPTGALIGKFMNKLGSLPLNDQNTPPAKRPFPWEQPQGRSSSKKGG
ncbi:MAG: hypothetical protein EBZ47_04075 [Chlamydiae bacterium]|nr:hypothetical protein [Chlamydiota bacterium]